MSTETGEEGAPRGRRARSLAVRAVALVALGGRRRRRLRPTRGREGGAGRRGRHRVIRESNKLAVEIRVRVQSYRPGGFEPLLVIDGKPQALSSGVRGVEGQQTILGFVVESPELLRDGASLALQMTADGKTRTPVPLDRGLSKSRRESSMVRHQPLGKWHLHVPVSRAHRGPPLHVTRAAPSAPPSLSTRSSLLRRRRDSGSEWVRNDRALIVGEAKGAAGVTWREGPAAAGPAQLP